LRATTEPRPSALIVAALAADGSCALARSSDPGLVETTLVEDPLGRTAEISGAALQALS
jgi:hypothetical protein